MGCSSENPFAGAHKNCPDAGIRSNINIAYVVGQVKHEIKPIRTE